jgi:rhamnogalacturonyl hydrolase YesR
LPCFNIWVLVLLLLALLAPAAAQVPSAIGVTRQGVAIECLLAPEDLDYNTRKTRILLVGGLDAARWFHAARDAAGFRKDFAVSAVAIAAPPGPYPPPGDAYGGAANLEAAYLWRWIGMHAPDLVVDVRSGPALEWHAPEGVALPFARRLAPSDDLVSQLVRVAPSATGTIPAVRVTVPPGKDAEFLPTLLAGLRKANFRGPSPARREIQQRLARSPLEVARQLSRRYGHELGEVVYIPTVALIGRLRLGEIEDVERIVAPYFSGEKPTLPAKPTGSHLSGHLVFGELARLTGKPRYIELVRAAADLGFDPSGQPRESMPFHNEMSDAVFMGCPILAQAGRLTGERKYFDMALRHMRFMLALNLRPDGLHRHSPLDAAAWGRGNGFPALGLALSLSEFPEDHPGRGEILAAFGAHVEALLPHQDPTGAWRQVIDVPGSYRELTATSMIAFAMIRGVRSGWLDKRRFEPAIDRAWYAIRTRVASDGGLVDVCTGTGKQKSLRDYLDRTAILGPDPRGGAMALLVATEMAAFHQITKSPDHQIPEFRQ